MTYIRYEVKDSKLKLEIKGSLSPTGIVQQWCRLHRSAVWSLLLEVLKTDWKKP